MHAVCTCEAFQAGKHVLCEARMAMNAEEAHQMFRLKKQHPELVAQIVPSPMTLRYDRTIKDLIRNGFLGDPLAVEIRDVSNTFIDPSRNLFWRENFDLSGYNVLSLGIWYEALMRWLGEVQEVTAMAKTAVKRRYDEQNDKMAFVRIPDHLSVIAEMVCGAQAHFLLSAVTGLAENGSSSAH